MQLLSDDDRNLQEMSEEDLELAWDLWFDLAQTTNDADPPYTHGVLVGLDRAGSALAALHPSGHSHAPHEGIEASAQIAARRKTR